MVLSEVTALINLFVACSLFSFFIELTFRFIKEKSLLAAIISAVLFGPLYGLSLTIFLSVKLDSLLFETILITFLLFLLETIKQLICSCLIPNLSEMNRGNLVLTMMIRILFFVCYAEWVYPLMTDTIRALPYTWLTIIIYSFLYIISVYHIRKILKELNQNIEELQLIDTALLQLQTAQNEIIHGIRELNNLQDEYVEAVHKECWHDMADLEEQYKDTFLKLSSLQQKLIKEYIAALSAKERFIPARRKNKSN